MAGSVVNPGTPYTGPIHGGLKDGMTIVVSGRAEHHHDQFVIGLQAGGSIDPRCDTAFWFNPRFNQNQVIRNTLQTGSWGAEESDGGFPFQKGQNFEISIHVQHNIFKVSVNGRHFCDFNHRIPKHCVTHITVEQGIHISQIRFDNHGHHGHHGGAPGPPAGAYPGGGEDAPVYNPPVPFTQTIPGGLYPNKMIFISGIPNPNPSRFSIYIQKGPHYEPHDISMVFDARFLYGSDKNVIVSNSRQHGNWGSEERGASYYPFMPNSSFDIIIIVEQNSYKIAVNNQHLLEFAHRVHPLGRADTLHITGDVRLTQIRFQ